MKFMSGKLDHTFKTDKEPLQPRTRLPLILHGHCPFQSRPCHGSFVDSFLKPCSLSNNKELPDLDPISKDLPTVNHRQIILGKCKKSARKQITKIILL